MSSNSIIRFYMAALLVFILGQGNLTAQSQEVTDTTRSLVNTTSVIDSLGQDSLNRHTEISPLDIGQDRGIFILSSDKLMQLRILGSVRSLFTFNDRPLTDENGFNPVEIPTDGSPRLESFYAGLEQTRLGFEVVRRTKQLGDLFVRIEVDFAAKDGGLRIRHAYGQMRNFIIGQTWSVFSNIEYMPATVSNMGPAGVIGHRTPQVRYFRPISDRISWYGAIEYSTANVIAPDTVPLEVRNIIPDFTAKLDYKKDKVAFQMAGLVTTLSGRDKSQADSKTRYRVGYGLSLSARMTTDSIGSFYSTLTIGSAIEHYLDVFSGKGMNVFYNAEDSRFENEHCIAASFGYSKQLPAKLSLNAASGFALILKEDYKPSGSYHISYNILINIFWQPVDGARIGLEMVHGRRDDIGPGFGRAKRVAALIYYDF